MQETITRGDPPQFATTRQSFDGRSPSRIVGHNRGYQADLAIGEFCPAEIAVLKSNNGHVHRVKHHPFLVSVCFSGFQWTRLG
jgi:hypothetical protein